MIVVDASAAVTALLTDGESRAHLAGTALASPHLVDSEVAHALRGQVRRGVLDAPTARDALDRWARLGLDRIPAVGFLGRIFDLRDDLSADDATYVAVAEALECPLLTADARLAGAPGIRCAVAVVAS